MSRLMALRDYRFTATEVLPLNWAPYGRPIAPEWPPRTLLERRSQALQARSGFAANLLALRGIFPRTRFAPAL
jgi:hypothetical protein